MIWCIVVFCLTLNARFGQSLRLVDCSRCGRFEYVTTCTTDNLPGVQYSRVVEENAGCEKEFCDNVVCDTTRDRACKGRVIVGGCDKNCEQKRRLFNVIDGKCIDILVFDSCEGGDCSKPTNSGPSPVETYDCSGCGEWKDVGNCRTPLPSGQYKWRRVPPSSDKCNPRECGNFACDISRVCKGEFVEGTCTEKCVQKYRVWQTTDDGTCQDRIEYWPCTLHDHCNADTNEIGINERGIDRKKNRLINQKDDAPGNLQLLHMPPPFLPKLDDPAKLEIFKAPAPIETRQAAYHDYNTFRSASESYLEDLDELYMLDKASIFLRNVDGSEENMVCVSSCGTEGDIVEFVNPKTSEMVFCDGHGYDSIVDIYLSSTVTSLECVDSGIIAIYYDGNNVNSVDFEWILTGPENTVLYHQGSWSVQENTQYKLFGLSVSTLSNDLSPGEYKVYTSSGGQATMRLFQVVSYDSVHPVSKREDVQVLCEVQGALEGDVTFTWEISDGAGGAMNVSTRSTESGYRVEEYTMGLSPISVLSIPPSLQHVTRVTLLCHVTNACGCHVTSRAELVIWDLQPGHNVTRQGQEGYLTLDIAGSDDTWPEEVLEVVRNADGETISRETYGYNITYNTNDNGELSVTFFIPQRETTRVGRQTYTFSVSYGGENKSTALHLHVIDVQQSPDVALQLDTTALSTTFSLSVKGVLLVPGSISWEHESELNNYKTSHSFVRTTLVVTGIQDEQQTAVSLSYSLMILGRDAPQLSDETVQFALTVFSCVVEFPHVIVCPGDRPTCYDTTVYQRGICTCSYGYPGTCREPTLQSVKCPATSRWALTEWTTLPCEYTECGTVMYTSRVRDCACQDTVDSAQCGEEVVLTERVECEVKEYEWTEWSDKACPQNVCYRSQVRRYRLCHCLGDVDFGKCEGDVIQNINCEPDKMCLVD